MENNFNYDDVKFNGSNYEPKYLSGGNHKVKVTEVTSGKSSAKQSPYVKITIADETGKTLSQDLYLTGGAFNISMNNIYTIIGATMGLDNTKQEDHEALKTKFGKPANEVEVATRLSSLVTGKQFAIHLDEEWINPTDTSKKSFKKAILGNGKFAVPVSKMSELKIDVRVKGTEAPAVVSSPVTDDWS